MATTTWHREEPREVRPFFRVIQAEVALHASGIRLFDDTDTRYETSFDLDEIDFKKLAPVVHIVLADPAGWLPADLGKDDLELVLIARHAFLKRSEQIHSIALGAAIPNEWAVGADVLERLGGGRNLELTLALCLKTDREPTPGSPFVVGHWLARKSFLLRSRTAPTLFDLRTRKDEDWLAKGYPAKTFYALEYIGGIDVEPEEGASVAIVWIHIDAHNKMVSSSLGESLQPMLAAEIILSILLESCEEWKTADSVEAASPLATLLKQLGKEKPLTLASLKNLVANPPLLKATLQDRLSVVTALK
jgi:hypothetical protein